MDGYNLCIMNGGIAAITESKSVSPARAKICRLTSAEEFRERMENDVKFGLSLPHRWIPSKYRYDAEGSLLFERIIEQPEYYPNRAETAILQERAETILKLTNPDELIELGSGSSKKTRLLIEAMCVTECRRYVPIDISEGALSEAADKLTSEYDWLGIQSQVGDYDHDLPKIRRNGRRLLAIFGTTVCNYRSKPECIKFVEKIKGVMNKGDSLLVGIDLLKDVSLISAAYNDKAGANAKFKLRVLDILNREVGSNFCVQDFEHVPRWNPDKCAMESLIIAQKDFTVSIPSLQMEIPFSVGDEILVGISCKFTKEEFARELTGIGLKVTACFTDSADRYGLFVACAV